MLLKQYSTRSFLLLSYIALTCLVLVAIIEFRQPNVLLAFLTIPTILAAFYASRISYILLTLSNIIIIGIVEYIDGRTPLFVFLFMLIAFTGTIILCETIYRQEQMRQAEINRRIAQERSLRHFAEQAAEQAKRQNDYLAAIHTTALEVLNRLDVDDLLHAIVQRTATLLNSSNGFIFLPNADETLLELRVGIGIQQAYIGLTLKPGEGLAGRVWQTQKSLVVTSYRSWEGRVRQIDSDQAEAAMAVPMMAANRVVAVLGLTYDDPQHRVDDHELHLLERFAQIAVIALDNAQLFQTIQQEIATRTHIEAALRREQQLFLAGPVMSFKWLTTNGGTLAYISPNITQFGYSPDELMALPHQYQDLIHPEDLDQISALMTEQVRRGATSFETNYRIIRADQQIRWVYHRMVVGRNPQGQATHLDGYVLDITAMKEAEEQRLAGEQQIQEAQRLESLGLLAGGIAHDFNNMLAAILGNASLIRMDLDDQHPALASLEQLEFATRRAADLTHQLLAYAGRARLTTQHIDLNSVITEVVALNQITLPSQANIEYHLSEPLPLIRGDATQIRQVVMNLLLNAADALEQGQGVITMMTSTQTIDQQTTVVLTVTDTGCGMDEITIKRIFDPFFTTKRHGRGLGLATVQGIIRSHQGNIFVDSQLGQGSRFSIHLPASPLTEDSLIL